jgi:NADPH2:quinone reductase
MKALLCKTLGPPEALTIETVDGPTAGPGEVVIRVSAVGLNFFDTLIIAGKYQYRPELPFSPGAEASGKVVQVGAGVTRLSVGERVMALTGWGALREEVAVKAEKCVALPDEVGDEAAAVLQVTYGTAYHALKERGSLKARETLVVLGAAGGTGQAAVEIGRTLGAIVVAVASSDDKCAFCQALGAHATINSTKEDVKARIREVTDGRGADVIFDPVGGDLTEQAFRSIAWGGRHLVVGFAAGEIPRLPLNLPLLKGASAVGVFWGHHAEREPERHRADMEQLLELLRQGRVRPHIDHRYRLEEANLALRSLAERRVKGKAVIVLA